MLMCVPLVVFRSYSVYCAPSKATAACCRDTRNGTPTDSSTTSLFGWRPMIISGMCARGDGARARVTSGVRRSNVRASSASSCSVMR